MRYFFSGELVYGVNETALRPTKLQHSLYFIVHPPQKSLLVPHWLPAEHVSVLRDGVRAGIWVSCESFDI